MNLVIKDAFWQILWRVASALWGFIVIKLITPYLWPLRFGDYSTILKYFAIWSAFADFGIYVIALKQLGVIKNEEKDMKKLSSTYSKFVSTRVLMIASVYTLALVVAYLIPAYTSNPYIIWWLPIWMMFSASFMGAGILQIPLQLFWKMEQLSLGLILARVGQLGLLCAVIFVLYPAVAWSDLSNKAFMLILASVLLSGLIQWAYVWWQWKKHMDLKREFDRSFTKNILLSNRKYWFAYYLSSFHTLIVLILLSWIYPTTQGYTFVGVWALALSLIEILLIVPSALGNSLIHKVSASSDLEKRTHFWHLCFLVTWIGALIVVLFFLFAPHVITFIWGPDYLSSAAWIGSERLLPWLWIILTLSFIKQVHNYLFVSTWHQNTLLWINLFGVIIGLWLAVPLIQKYQLLGWLIAQWVLELLFVFGALFVAWKNEITLKIHSLRYALLRLLLIDFVLFVPKDIFFWSVWNIPLWVWQGFLVVTILTGISYIWLKDSAKGL